MLRALAEVVAISMQLHGRSTERRDGNYDTSSAAVSGGSGLSDQCARPSLGFAPQDQESPWLEVRDAQAWARTLIG
jgi:hypothetical protein